MTKTIKIRKPKVYVFTKEDENIILKTHIEIKSLDDCKILTPYKTKIVYVNKNNQKVIKHSVFLKTGDNSILVKKYKFYTYVNFEKCKIYAQMSLIDESEKGNFVDFISKLHDDMNLEFILNNQHISFEELVQLYIENI